MKTLECHRIPTSVMDSVISDVQSLYNVALEQLGDNIQSALNEAGVAPEVINSVAREIAGGTHAHILRDLLHNLSSLHISRSTSNLW